MLPLAEDIAGGSFCLSKYQIRAPFAKALWQQSATGMTMPIGLLTLEIYIPEAHSLKDKRQVLRSLKDRLRRKFNVAVAEASRAGFTGNALWWGSSVCPIPPGTSNNPCAPYSRIRSGIWGAIWLDMN